jgi:hypothetical protein
MSIQVHIAKLGESVTELRNHCLCYNCKWEGTSLLVYLPLGYDVDAVRVADSGKGKTDTINRMLVILERIWKDSIL